MWVVFENGKAWHIVILQPTGVELIIKIISHSILGPKLSQFTWLDQILSDGSPREKYSESWLSGLFVLLFSLTSFHSYLTVWNTIRYRGKLTVLMISTAGSNITWLTVNIYILYIWILKTYFHYRHCLLPVAAVHFKCSEGYKNVPWSWVLSFFSENSDFKVCSMLKKWFRFLYRL